MAGFFRITVYDLDSMMLTRYPFGYYLIAVCDYEKNWNYHR